jgi:acetylornithine deacetylase/succinyl-diaminopimelate desuccinylase-like protein
MKKFKLVLALLSLVMVLSILPLPATAQSAVNCGHNRDIETLLNQVTENGIAKWIRDLSGENPVIIDGQQHHIRTRLTSELFNPANQNAKAYPYLTQELIKLGYIPGVTMEDHAFSYSKIAPKNLDHTIPDPEPIEIDAAGAMNLVLTIPGHGPNANQQVLMTAHLDSVTYSDGNPRESAPGAEDNASGIAALMEAARLFRYYKFDRTIKIIFFTAEE